VKKSGQVVPARISGLGITSESGVTGFLQEMLVQSGLNREKDTGCMGTTSFLIKMPQVEIRPVDARGRITLPKAWRNRFRSRNVLLIDEDDRLEIRQAADADLSRFVDSVEIDTTDFGDSHKLHKGLRKKKRFFDAKDFF
jgi:AbrB family looped-hinge helix DNA binding protein